MTVQEISDFLGIAATAVQTAQREALASLRGIL
jgi:hypothetical protein